MKQANSKNAATFYEKEELLANSQELFSCSPEVLFGAWHALNESQFTVEMTKELIENFLQRKVQE